jgi:tricorn protease
MLAFATAHALPNVRDTRLLSDPAISADRIAFIYAGDLWTSSLDGRDVRRITSDVGEESDPVFSPDGKLIAFNAAYEGNTDVYVVGVEGGVPRRLTFHPGADEVQGFTPDGRHVLFTSARDVFTNRHKHLFTVPVEGGVETPLGIPTAWRAAYSPDGKRLAYVPVGPAYVQWKHYRGGRTAQISLFTFADRSVEKIPQPESRCNDADPQWVGDIVYFRSDRDGEFNLYAYDTRSKAVTRLTSHADFPVLAAAVAGSRAVYEQAGYLHSMDLATKASSRLAIGVAADLALSRPRYVKGAKYLRNFSPSPSAARIAFEFRGEIVTVPGEKGDLRNLTNTVGAHERSPAWSPDGRFVAYFSDESGEYELHVRPQEGDAPARKFKLAGSGYYDRPEWSPDGKRLAFTDNGWSLYVIELAGGTVKKVATEPLYGPVKSLRGRFSPDSRWVAYTLNSATYTRSAWVYSVGEDRSYRITDGLSDVTDPVFDRGGKYLYFLASTDAGPSNNWFSLENTDNKPTRTLWLAVLRSDTPSPLTKESDEEKAGAKDDKKDTDPKKESEEPKDADAKDKAPPKEDAAARKPGESPKKPAAAPKAPEPVRIDFDGIANRIIDFPIPAAEISSLQAGAEGQVFFLRRADEKNALRRFDLKDRKAETLLPEVDEYRVSDDGKKVVWRLKEEWHAAAAAGKEIKPADGKLRTDAIEVRVDPRQEWTQVFEEAWRINRDYFYDPGMHGLDWKAIHAKYAQFLPDLATRGDLFRLIRWMGSELVVGHHYQQPGDNFIDAKPVPGGLLGADYEVANGRYRFRKVYGGLNWNYELRAPLTEPGVNVKAGEYLLAVGGRKVAPPDNLYMFFENTAGKLTSITVGPNADGRGSRTVAVVPVASEDALRNRDWVEGNIRKVDAATGGRVAYVYVPNTANLGHTYFKRYFFPQAYKDAIIVDERSNGGGSIADYYITNLKRGEIAWWTMRYGADMKTPSASIQGPKVMLIDEGAGSGGDLLPWMFRREKIGPLIGKRTWGGLIGILGYPVLMDGGQITAPNLAFWTREDGWSVENEGVAPDIDVEQVPSAVMDGHDPQLERAIAVVMDELKAHPPSTPKHPPFPVKARTPG